MPTERFFNLPDEKRKRIIHAAHEEMGRVLYDQISINKIIQRADIPRGSFYQYFANLDDLLSYMMEDFQEQLYEIIAETLKSVDGDAFKTVFLVISKFAEMGEQGQNCTLIRNVFQCLRENVHFMKKIQHRGIEYEEQLYNMVDKSNLNINSIEEYRDVEYLLAMLLWNSVMEIFINMNKKEEIIKKTKRRLEIIKYGVIKEENPNV
ncbi:MAG: TetR/AcrR family transcriptional regulator [Lachnospiraceae bacterium]|nr:TetR/AcrR family transcriptional regulator [Lachnospiraceae bacterium]